MLIGISGAELERRGECESRNWRTISRSYYIKVMPTKMPFVGQAPHACRFKAKRYSYSVIRSARELSGAAARPPQCSAEPPCQPGAAERRQPRSSRPPEEPPSSQSRRAHRAAVLTCLLNRCRRASWFGAAVRHSLEGRLGSRKWTLRAAVLDPRSRRPQAPPCAAPLCFCTFGALPSPREKRPSGQEGRVITLKPGLALPSQRELARLDKSRHRSL